MFSRREFLAGSALAVAGAGLTACVKGPMAVADASRLRVAFGDGVSLPIGST